VKSIFKKLKNSKPETYLAPIKSPKPTQHLFKSLVPTWYIYFSIKVQYLPDTFTFLSKPSIFLALLFFVKAQNQFGIFIFYQSLELAWHSSKVQYLPGTFIFPSKLRTCPAPIQKPGTCLTHLFFC